MFRLAEHFLGDIEPLRMPVPETTVGELAMIDPPAFLNDEDCAPLPWYPHALLGFLQELRAKA
jgi:hypothetical protein